MWNIALYGSEMWTMTERERAIESIRDVVLEINGMNHLT